MDPAELNRASYAWITGACMLLSMKAIKSVGMFNPRFFMYWEDADLCVRLRRAGYRFEVAPDALVHHVAGTSSNMNRLKRYGWHIKSQNLWVSLNYKYKRWGMLIIFLRHVLKSLFSRDFQRLGYTFATYWDR